MHSPGPCASLWSMSYDPPINYKRTDAERRDQRLAWQRPDKAFFAAGACHILAWTFLEVYPAAGFRPVGLRRVGQAHPGHAYVTDGTWAFDHDGWTLEEELLEVTRCAHTRSGPEIEIERLDLGVDLEAFCVEHNSRTPDQFAFDPRPRALRYLATFDTPDEVLGTSAPG